jgi:peptide/nickel transport system permease protein
MLIGTLIAVPASVAGAIWPNRFLSALLSGFAAVGIAIPTFVIGILLIITLGVELEWLPTQGYVSFQADPVGSVKSTLLPAITLGIGVAAATMRILRPSLLDVGTASFVRTARGEGPAAAARSSSSTSCRTRPSPRSPSRGSSSRTSSAAR